MPKDWSAKDLRELLVSRKHWIAYVKAANDPREEQAIIDEFLILVEHDRVDWFQVTARDIALTSAPTIEIDGVLYSLGDYLVHIRPKRIATTVQADSGTAIMGMEVRCLKSARVDKVQSHLYTMSHATFPGHFCFGARNEFVTELLLAREYFTLITTVLESLWHVNPSDYHKVVQDYRRATPRKDSQ